MTIFNSTLTSNRAEAVSSHIRPAAASDSFCLVLSLETTSLLTGTIFQTDSYPGSAIYMIDDGRLHVENARGMSRRDLSSGRRTQPEDHR